MSGTRRDRRLDALPVLVVVTIGIVPQLYGSSVQIEQFFVQTPLTTEVTLRGSNASPFDRIRESRVDGLMVYFSPLGSGLDSSIVLPHAYAPNAVFEVFNILSQPLGPQLRNQVLAPYPNWTLLTLDGVPVSPPYDPSAPPPTRVATLGQTLGVSDRHAGNAGPQDFYHTLYRIDGDQRYVVGLDTQVPFGSGPVFTTMHAFTEPGTYEFISFAPLAGSAGLHYPNTHEFIHVVPEPMFAVSTVMFSLFAVRGVAATRPRDAKRAERGSHGTCGTRWQ